MSRGAGLQLCRRADGGVCGAVAAQGTSTSAAAPKEGKTTDTTGDAAAASLGGLVASRRDVFVELAEPDGTPLVSVGPGVRPADWPARLDALAGRRVAVTGDRIVLRAGVASRAVGARP